MSGAVDHFGDPDATPMSRVSTRVAHAILPVAAVAVATDVGRVVSPAIVPVWASWVSGWTLVVVWIITTCHVGLARICVRCMQEVPADAPARAQRQRPVLRLEHLSRGGWFSLGVLAAMFGVGWLRLQLYPDAAARAAGDGMWMYLTSDAFIFAIIYADWLHHRLRPWCPFCPRWDDGGGLREPSPDPTTSGVKS